MADDELIEEGLDLPEGGGLLGGPPAGSFAEGEDTLTPSPSPRGEGGSDELLPGDGDGDDETGDGSTELAEGEGEEDARAPDDDEDSAREDTRAPEEPVKFHGREDGAIAQSILHLQQMLGLTPDPLAIAGADRGALIRTYQQLETVIGYPEDVRPFVLQEMGLQAPSAMPQSGAQAATPEDDPVYQYANAEYQRLFAIEKARMEASGLYDEELGMPEALNQALIQAAYSYGREKYAEAQRTAPLLRQIAPQVLQHDVTQIIAGTPQLAALGLTGAEVATEIEARMARQGVSPEQWQQASPQERATAVQMIGQQMVIDRYRSSEAARAAKPAIVPKQTPPGSLRQSAGGSRAADPEEEGQVQRVMDTTGLSRADALAAVREAAGK